MNLRVFTKKALLLAITVVTVLAAGCATAPPAVTPQPTAPTQPAPTTITDHLGRVVEIPEKVEKIISCYYVSTSTLIALGQTNKLAAIEMSADTRELYKRAAPSVIKLPAIGNSKTFNLETCAAISPDLVIIPTRLSEFIPQIEKMGIAVVAVLPESERQFLEMLDMFGTILGGEAKVRADKLSAFFTEKLNLIRSAQKQNNPTCYIAGNSSYFSTATGNMFQSALVELAGGVNVAGGLTDNYWVNVSAEQIAQWNPDYIFMTQGAAYSANDIYSNASLAEVNAVKNKSIMQIPSKLEGWDYPNPSVVLGALWFFNKLQPELYSAEQLDKDCAGFYKEFYGIDITRTDLGYAE